MKWYYQEVSESGSFDRSGWSIEWFRCNSKKSVEELFENWLDDHDAVGADRKYASLHVYKGAKGDYPDFIVKLGPRGGIVWERC